MGTYNQAPSRLRGYQTRRPMADTFPSDLTEKPELSERSLNCSPSSYTPQFQYQYLPWEPEMSELVKGTASPKQQNTYRNLVKCTLLHKHRPETMNPGRLRLKPTGNRGNPDKILHNFDHGSQVLKPYRFQKGSHKTWVWNAKTHKRNRKSKTTGNLLWLDNAHSRSASSMTQVSPRLNPTGELFQTPLKTLATSMAIGRA
jgi:hypothetical protein